MMDGIRIELCFQRKRAAFSAVFPAFCSGDINVIPGIKLYARKRRINFHDAAALFAAVYDKVVIIAADQKQLFVVLVDILPDFFGFCKIKNSAGDISDLPGRNRTFDDRRKRAAMQFQNGVQNPARIIAVQIPVSVIRQIDNGRFVRSCVIVSPAHAL